MQPVVDMKLGVIRIVDGRGGGKRGTPYSRYSRYSR